MKERIEGSLIFFLRYHDCSFQFTQQKEGVYCFSRQLSYSATPGTPLCYPAREETVACNEAVRDELFLLLENTQLVALCRQIESNITHDTITLESGCLDVSCKSLQLDFEAGVSNYPELAKPAVQLRLTQLIVQLSSLFTLVQQHAYPFNQTPSEARHGRAMQGLLDRYFK